MMFLPAASRGLWWCSAQGRKVCPTLFPLTGGRVPGSGRFCGLASAFSHEAKSGGQRKVGVKHPPRRAAVAFAAWRVQKYGQKDSRPNFHRPGGILVENKTESAGISHAVFHIRRGDVERMWKTVRRGAYAENRWPVPDIHRRSGTGRERCRCSTAPPASRNSARPVAVSRAGRCRAFPLP